MRKSMWDEQKISELKLLVQKGLKSENIGNILHTSGANIRSKCADLGISLKGRIWVEEKINLLKECINSNIPILKMVSILNVSRGTICRKIEDLGMKELVNINPKTHWHENEIEKLIKLRKDGFTIREISKILNKNKYSVEEKCSLLKIKPPENWTKDQDILLKELTSKENKILDIALKLNKTYAQIYNRIARLGLTSDGISKRKEMRNFRKKFGNSILIKLIGCRHSKIQYKCTKENLSFDLTREFLLEIYNKQNGKCFYSGIEMELDHKKLKMNDNPYLLSIDRIDSDKGYTQDNIVLCCLFCNTMKSTFSVKEFFRLCKIIIDYNKI
ncbi:MAG: hypothetical protein Q7R95_10580 [bacterium]|nr:hypothetical protein [bacterium]